MHYLRACITGGHVLQKYMYYERTYITESYVLKVGCLTGEHV